ncbi:diguanylate cyclase [Bacillus coahuilensis m2-6]|uniref:sensor domain-containing diguanylate cyclase n=1 Tax=Bacillus coahuilensis TaxID=408580 RepID=UPI0002FC55C3|nr:diguanylate cyclase [Bacillus coahuilensis]KUP04070.1 diguanylate cyclase [Bacillus coahuilensis m2-6]
MSSSLIVSITLISTSIVLNLYICLYVFIKRKHYISIANVFLLHSVFSLIYCVGSVFLLMSTSLLEIKFWNTVLYAGMPFSATMGLLFIIKYLGIHFSKIASWCLMIVPMISFLMVATNDWHQLHYRVLELDPLQGAPFVYLEMGVWYIIHGFYTFGSMFGAVLLVVSRWRDTEDLYRPQLMSLLFGQLIPIVTAFVYLLGLTPTGIDPVPMVLWLTSLFYLWSISTSRMFTLIPIAKDAIFNSINDGVMVVDESRRLVEFNDACKRMFPHLDVSMFGDSFSVVWDTISDVSFPIELGRGSESSQQDLIQHRSKDATYTYQVQISNVQGSEGLLIIFTDMTEVKNLQSQLEHFAYYDELTGIYNRRAFFQYCEEAFQESKEQDTPFTIILMDIDYFKKVNDTYGHSVGDQVLEQVAKVCQSQLHGHELFARYGGEEFVLGVKGYTEEEGAALAEQLRSEVEALTIHTPDGKITVTLSLGVAALTKEDEALYQILNHADQALYRAKEAGRNRVCVYQNSTPELV